MTLDQVNPPSVESLTRTLTLTLTLNRTLHLTLEQVKSKRLNPNPHPHPHTLTLTLEQVLSKRKRLVGDLGDSLAKELKMKVDAERWALGTAGPWGLAAVERTAALEAHGQLMRHVLRRDAGHYNNDEAFLHAITAALNSSSAVSNWPSGFSQLCRVFEQERLSLKNRDLQIRLDSKNLGDAGAGALSMLLSRSLPPHAELPCAALTVLDLRSNNLTDVALVVLSDAVLVRAPKLLLLDLRNNRTVRRDRTQTPSRMMTCMRARCTLTRALLSRSLTRTAVARSHARCCSVMRTAARLLALLRARSLAHGPCDALARARRHRQPRHARAGRRHQEPRHGAAAPALPVGQRNR
jgi:hypothetical protein